MGMTKHRRLLTILWAVWAGVLAFSTAFLFSLTGGILERGEPFLALCIALSGVGMSVAVIYAIRRAMTASDPEFKDATDQSDADPELN